MSLGSFTLLEAQDPTPYAPLQQQNVNTADKPETKMGVKFTIGTHKFAGTAFDESKVLYGFGMGFYHLVHLNKAKSHYLHWELNFTFKGSRFPQKTNDTGSAYSKISLGYLELPVYYSVRLNESENPVHLFAGGQFSVLFRSTLNKNFGRYNQQITGLPFNDIDVSPVIGIRKDLGRGISFQVAYKPGLFTIWNNRFFETAQLPDPPIERDYRDLSPAFRDGTHTVFNRSLEFSFLF